MPDCFDAEEEKLINEFTQISGISDVLISSNIATGNMSGVALEIIMEQETNRLNNSADQIKFAVKEIGRQILRLYKQFVAERRISKIIGDNGKIEMFYWKNTDISCDDVVLNTENEVGETLTQRRNMIFELLRAGLLQDENGKLNSRLKAKTLQMLGFGNWEVSNDLTDLNLKRAGKENLLLLANKVTEVFEVDDHEAHIGEHTAFMLSDEFEKQYEINLKLKDVFMEHINAHRKFLKQQDLM
jgi:hypothetical protein